MGEDRPKATCRVPCSNEDAARDHHRLHDQDAKDLRVPADLPTAIAEAPSSAARAPALT